ncbi:helix-turn-helix transcriptional regulator [Paraliomyxa miuraensis]|uniref:helix-turn-helix transcriptional regulator n=1 Tax=Paraliomyxa miuraensis TaxID=376150 RepID=UPI0022534CCB|nr:transcriptional regulator [Paraliomyxa miuraensis]MCX4245366.1 transcriptional regulator [Paraliomyxa miuraensis]
MSSRSARNMLIRQWQILQLLHGRRRGLSPKRLLEETGSSRATLYRDLDMLEQAGVPLLRETINGEARINLLGDKLPELTATPLQWDALRLARSYLGPLEGTSLLDELDALLERNRPRKPGTVAEAPETQSSTDTSDSRHARSLRVLDAAIAQRKKVRFRYRSAGDTEYKTRTVDPLMWRLVDEHVYLIAFEPKVGYRTFKVARMSHTERLDQDAAVHDVDEDELFRGAVKIWSGPPVEVAIRLSPYAARLLPEYPLSREQEVVPQPDGGAILRARVAGTKEVLRWVLHWGVHAEVLAPPSLREELREELREALAPYEDEDPH